MNSHSLSPVEGDPRAYIDRTREREKFLACSRRPRRRIA